MFQWKVAEVRVRLLTGYNGTAEFSQTLNSGKKPKKSSRQHPGEKLEWHTCPWACMHEYTKTAASTNHYNRGLPSSIVPADKRRQWLRPSVSECWPLLLHSNTPQHTALPIGWDRGSCSTCRAHTVCTQLQDNTGTSKVSQCPNTMQRNYC